jgi:hypothetical protein
MAVVAVLAVAATADALARGTYQTPEAFIGEAFAGRPPEARTFWLTEAMQQEVVRVLGHRYPAMRLRYWARDGRSAWVLEEIGKDEPITAGIVVNRSRIEWVKVLIFRESRGDEVRHTFFTDQFKETALRADGRLDRPIDGISGATLSVRALERLARLALYLHGRSGLSP